MAKLNIKNVYKKYSNGYEALQDISIDIKDGEFIVIVGPSGCGKSTLMRMVAGLEDITEGEIIIGNEVVNEFDPSKRNISMVFQNYALYPHMSVFDNMAYGLKISKMPKDEIKKKVAEIAVILGLDELLDRKPKELSGGQRQRVAMGRAIVRDPEVFLFDEPLSNLDAKLRVQMRLEIRKLQKRFQTTSLYVTHDQVEAMTLADRIMVLNKGKVEQIGTPQEIFDTPSSIFVAQFMGSPPMNLIKVKVNDSGEIDDHDFSIPLEHYHKESLLGQEVYLGIRPEHLEVNENGIPFYVEMVEILGSEHLIHLKRDNVDFVMRKKMVNNSEKYCEGDTIKIWIDTLHQVSWFSCETGLAVI